MHAPEDWRMDFQTALASWMTGFGVCLVLVASIGAQNLFVLRQALGGRHVRACVAWCVGSDVALMSIGVSGMAQVLSIRPGLAHVLAIGGALFLLCYGLLALSRLLPGHKTTASANLAAPTSRRRVLAALAALTLLNPHVYLDTVLLMGSVGAREEGSLKLAFVAGAASASVLWFLSLALAGSRLRHVFERPGAWRALDAFTGVTMLVLAWWVWGGVAALPF